MDLKHLMGYQLLIRTTSITTSRRMANSLGYGELCGPHDSTIHSKLTAEKQESCRVINILHS